MGNIILMFQRNYHKIICCVWLTQIQETEFIGWDILCQTGLVMVVVSYKQRSHTNTIYINKNLFANV